MNITHEVKETPVVENGPLESTPTHKVLRIALHPNASFPIV